MKRLLVFSDNARIHAAMAAYFRDNPGVSFGCSSGDLGTVFKVKEQIEELADRFDLILSAHCKQIFPAELVARVRCVNLHPGFNPETRGWYPQVWAILNGLKVGFTLHLMDAEIDHGAILFRREVPVRLSDTSKTLYERIIEAEIASIPEWMPALVEDRLAPVPPEGEGVYHSKADFAALCEIDLDEQGSFRDFYNRLRATSFPPFRNAWFRDPGTGGKIFVSIQTED